MIAHNDLKWIYYYPFCELVWYLRFSPIRMTREMKIPKKRMKKELWNRSIILNLYMCVKYRYSHQPNQSPVWMEIKIYETFFPVCQECWQWPDGKSRRVTRLHVKFGDNNYMSGTRCPIILAGSADIIYMYWSGNKYGTVWISSMVTYLAW